MDEMAEMRNVRPEPTERSLFAARGRLTTEITSGRRHSIAVRLPVPRRGVTRVATAGTLTVALAGGLIVSQTVDFSGPPADIVRDGGGGGDGPAAVANADVFLDRAADAAPDYESAEPDDFGYVETKTVFFGEGGLLSGSESSRRHMKQWQSVNASRAGVLRSKVTPAESWMLIPDVKADPGQPKKTAKWQDQRLPTEDEMKADRWQYDVDLQNPNYAYLESLPRDPEALAAEVRRTCAEDGCNLGGFNVVTYPFRDAVVPPEVRGALLKAAKRIDDVRLIEDVRLAATGERGVAVAYTGGAGQEAAGRRYEMVFDPKTYEVLGFQEVQAPRPIPTHPEDVPPNDERRDNGGRPAADAGPPSGQGNTASSGDENRVRAGEEKTVTADPGNSGAAVPEERQPVEPGTVLRSTAIVDKGIVDEVGQAP